MYDTGVHVCRHKCTLKSSGKKVRNLFNIFFRDVKEYQYDMGLHDGARIEYRCIHTLHDIMQRVYVKLCNIFRHVLLLDECMKILKTLDVTQLKLGLYIPG